MSDGFAGKRQRVVNLHVSLLSSILTVKELEVSVKLKKLTLIDNGGKRWGGDRRNYSYSLHIPERRNGHERRSGYDRRKIARIKLCCFDESKNGKFPFFI